MPALFKLTRDGRLHLLAGALFVLGLFATLALARWLGWGYAMIASSVVMGWAVERYQAIRREGVASGADWLCSSLPGMLCGAALEAAQALGWVPPWA